MWATARIDEVATSIHRAVRALGHLIAQHLRLVWIVLEQLESDVLGNGQPLELLLLADDLSDDVVQLLVVVLGDLDLLRGHATLIEEVILVTFLGRRTHAQLKAVLALEGLSENVRARVPEHLPRLLAIDVQELQDAVLFKWTPSVNELTVELGHARLIAQLLRDAAGNVKRRGLSSNAIHYPGIGQCDLDGLLLCDDSLSRNVT